MGCGTAQIAFAKVDRVLLQKAVKFRTGGARLPASHEHARSGAEIQRASQHVKVSRQDLVLLIPTSSQHRVQARP
jgi:hypothetical protein